MKKIVLTEEMKAYIEKNRLNMTIKEIADKLKVNKHTVRSYLSAVKLDYKICAKKNREELTTRETEIMELVAIGYSNEEICDTLKIADTTLKTHLYHIYSKYGLYRTRGSVLRVRAVLRYLKERNNNE